jgi:chromodomain-helicase-DNA-binding protein 1
MQSVENRTEPVESIEEYKLIDRIIDSRNGNKEYLIKWKSVPYEGCTWEDAASLTSADDKVYCFYHMNIHSSIQQKVREYKNLISECTKAKSSKNRGTSRVLSPDSIEIPTFKSPELKLKEFQAEGFKWLSFNWHHKRNSMLADEVRVFM